MIKKNKTISQRCSFASTKPAIDCPDLLEIQFKSFQDFFQFGTSPEKQAEEGLYKVFQENFPIEDARGNASLEFVNYTLTPPKYLPEECIERGVTYAVSLKARLRLLSNDNKDEGFKTIEQEVFLGNIPYMTPKGSFIINGAERVVISQIHRSPGVFFAQSKHISGAKLYSAKIIPFRGAWIEFATDVHNTMYAYIDRKKKFPITTLLRAIGYGTDKEILAIFGLSEEVKTTPKALKKKIGSKLALQVLRTWMEDSVDENTGEVATLERSEVLFEANAILDEKAIEILLASGVKSVVLHRENANLADYEIIYNTLAKDSADSEKAAVEQIYRQLRNTEAPDEQTARETIQGLFFSNKRYNLGMVGRHKINAKLGTDVPADVSVLTKKDILQIVTHLLGLINAKSVVDDIDHLSNRRIRTVGEQLHDQFAIGLSRLARTIKERMSLRDNEDFKPTDIVNSRTLSSVISSFFGTNPLSQLMDQVNPLAEVTHKRRVSALGPGGLSRERAGFEIRDIHHTHYGRLCTIETPEGPNIGLLSSLAIYAKINNLGFIETPYRSVKNGSVALEGKTVYLTAEEEDKYHIAQANAKIDEQGRLLDQKIKARLAGDFPLAAAKDITYMDIAPDQIVSIAASLIPFLEHNDASRALMGSNMQRQAVPLIQPEIPIVGTGIEKHVAQDFRGLIRAEKDGTIEYVDASKIVVKYERSEEEQLISFEEALQTYQLPQMKGTNQGTCINLKPIVFKGEQVRQGQILCEGYSTKDGELALGRNLKVAFMSWQGYNYEDAIVISERVVREDLFTSIHIEEFSLEIRDTKLGEEELTAELPNASEEAISHLDKNGIAAVGTTVQEGDILIGKIAPKGETDPTPEEKLLRAIFGDKAGNVKDASLRAPSSMHGVVVDTKLFLKPQRDKSSRDNARKKIELLKKLHAQNLSKLRASMIEKLSQLLQGEKSKGVYHQFGDELISSGKQFTTDLLEASLFPSKNLYHDESYYNIPEETNLIGDVVLADWTENTRKNSLVKQLVINYTSQRNAIISNFRREKLDLEVGDELPTGILKLAKVRIAKKRELQAGDKMAGRHGNKGIVARIVRQEDMPFLADGTPVDIVLSPLGLPSRMNLGQIYEALLGWAGEKLGKKYATPIFAGASMEDVARELEEAQLAAFGRTELYDGLTGEKFGQKVTVGVIYMLKLDHLADDKIHARSIGPYSLITQQPLGGRAKFGGQRFGEMELWALEAFGAAHVLQEMLTTKSDDVLGRSKTYEAIVKGASFPEPDIPESFSVLIHELRGLGLEITLK
ncbi:MAG: DNA-directed RNA polymerase subunit beta [Bacteroidota bacterium]